MGLSRLSAECQACPWHDKCDNKRMEALGYLPLPNTQDNRIKTGSANRQKAVQIDINLNGSVATKHKDYMQKQLRKVFECGFLGRSSL